MYNKGEWGPEVTISKDESEETKDLKDFNYTLQTIRAAAMWKLGEEKEVKIPKGRRFNIDPD